MATVARMYGTVVTTERLSPEMVRVVLGGEGLADFTPVSHTDAYVNCFFLPPGAGYAPPFADDGARELPAEQRPRPRRFSVRHWDAAERQLTIDFVVHGDVGHAGRWATHARPGDRLQLRGPAGGYSPHEDAESYLLVGDESALPAMAACAEAMPPGLPVVVVAEVAGPEGEVPLGSPGQLEVHWVHRADHPGDPTHLLADAVRALPRPAGALSAFVHGEAESVRAVRRHLLQERWVDAEHLSASPYWRRGHTDEEWRSVKSAWTREMAGDVPD